MGSIIKSDKVHFHYENDYLTEIENTKAPVKEILKGISLEINKGEFVAVLGHNGSGKSTFANILCDIITYRGPFILRILIQSLRTSILLTVVCFQILITAFATVVERMWPLH